MAKVLVLMSSPRVNGNTNKLVDAFIKGINGYEVEKVYLSKLGIKPCLGCNVCQTSNKCVQNDDMLELYQKMLEAKVIVYASPVYFYTFNGIMKNFIDRTFAIEKIINNKDFYLLATGLAPDESYFKIINDTFSKYIYCLRAGGNVFKDYVFACGDIEGNVALDKAYNLAKGIVIDE